MGALSLAQAEAGSDDRARLLERVTAYWQAEVQRDYVTSYQIFDPAVRAVTPLPAYVRGKRYLTVKGFQVEGIEVKGETASVQVGYRFEIEIPPPPAGMARASTAPVTKEGVLEDRWVRLDGTWFRTVSSGEGRRPE